MLFPSRPIEALPHKETSQRRHATNKRPHLEKKKKMSKTATKMLFIK